MHGCVLESTVCCLLIVGLFPGVGSYGAPLEMYLHRAWSDWTTWSTCSRTCGGGVRLRTRICRLRLLQYAAKSNSCFGETTEYAMCGKRNCPPHSDFLSFQCSRQNGQKVAGRAIEQWFPFMNVKLPCELQCISQDRTALFTFGKVIDGTSCKPTHGRASSGICVNGRCTNVDCTGQLGWDNLPDRCGVCRGDNSSCIHYRNTFWSRPRTAHRALNKSEYHYEYNRIVEIPVGVTNLLIREYSEENFLAIMEENGNVLINGNWKVLSPGRFKGDQGLEFSYMRSATGQESISTSGPTEENLLILVFGKGYLPTVDYEYWISKHRAETHPKTRFKHRHLSGYFNSDNSTVRSGYHLDRIPQYESESRNPNIQGYRSYYHLNKILPDDHKFKPFGRRKADESVKATRHHWSKPGEDNYPNKTLHIVQPIIDPPENPAGFSEKYRYHFKKDNLAFASKESFSLAGISNVWHRRPNVTAAFTGLRHRSPAVLSPSGNSTTQRRSRQAVPFGSEHQTSTENSSPRKKKHRKNQKQKFSKKRKREKDEKSCPPCPKVKKARKSYCTSDFVLRATVLAYEVHGLEVRYEVEIIQSFKNTMPILAKEYIWVAELCRCPSLRTGQEYVLMGRLDASRRESRLALGRDSFVRRYTRQRARSIQKIVRDQRKICRQ